MAQTYDLANENPELASAVSPFTGERVNRFLHISASPADLVMQNKMQRRLGQLTGTCFQRCVGMDALNSLHSVTFDLDEKYGTEYHRRFTKFLTQMQKENFVIGGAMTDVKGDRGKSPSQQADPDLFVHVTRRTAEGKTPREIRRCLKRYIARELYPHITAIDLHQPTQIAA